jgi:hypothetical protein
MRALTLVLLAMLSTTASADIAPRRRQGETTAPRKTSVLSSRSRHTIGYGADKVTIKFHTDGDLARLGQKLKDAAIDDGGQLKLSQHKKTGVITAKAKTQFMHGEFLRDKLMDLIRGR